MVNKVRVNIAGTPYAIATTDSEKYILGLAKKLDEDITKLLDTNDNLSVTKAAVFCAMDYLDEYRKSTGSAENMRSQIQDYIADAARAKLAEDKNNHDPGKSFAGYFGFKNKELYLHRKTTQGIRYLVRIGKK